MKKIVDGIVGFAIGDALGVPVEFKSREQLKENPIKDMIGYGTYNMPAGTWSDDTSMTLATIHSIIEKGAIDWTSITPDFVNDYCKLKWLSYDEYLTLT